MELLLNNYIRETGRGASWDVEVDLPHNTFDNYHNECIRTAEIIWSKKQGKLYLMYSGGIDSEYVLSVLLSKGMDVTPVLIKLNPGYNNHDLEYAFKYCQSKGITPLVVDIDFDHFVKSGKIFDIAKRMESSVYHYAATASVVGSLDGTVLMGHGEPYINLNTKTNQWDVVRNQYEFAMLKYYSDNGILGTPEFLSYTSEQYFSFLSNPRIKELADHKHYGKLGSNSSKYIVYNSNNTFNLEPRQKYTGYENIENSEIFNHDIFSEFSKLKKKWGGTFRVAYYEFMKNV
jgi:hypothetical protein